MPRWIVVKPPGLLRFLRNACYAIDMPVSTLQVRQFGAFEASDFEFAPGLNVFIGPNGTGKTHVLKLLYACMDTLRVWSQDRLNAAELGARLDHKLAGVFKPDRGDVGRLARRRHGKNTASVDLVVHEKRGNRQRSLALDFEMHTGRGVTRWTADGGGLDSQSVFLPTREVLAMYEGFIAAYVKRELSFDETYYDACVALNATPLRGPSSMASLLQKLRDGLGGHVELAGERFYVKFRGDKKGRMEAHLVAEGLRKFACLERLVQNGALRKSSYLFWDEPEANLHPRLISVTADVLATLAAEGIQVFLSTHDYLLARRLSLATRQPKNPATRFFGFFRQGSGPVEVAQGDRLEDLPDNPMVDEFARLYDLELELAGR